MIHVSRVFAGLVAISLAWLAANANPSLQLAPDRVRGELVAPTNPSHQAIYDQLKEQRVLERLVAFFASFRLPRDILIKVTGCDGDDNAYYGDGEVTVCYEYLDHVLNNARQSQPSSEPARPYGAKGAIIDVFFHEMGHAIFDLWKIPVLGREEDAADQFSTYLLLQLRRHDTRALILGVAQLGRREAREEMLQKVQIKHYADDHGFSGQRYFNLLCAAYGFDQQLFADAISNWNLPAERAEGCADEYAQLHRAFQALIRPNIDQERFNEVLGKETFEFEIR